jgi:hypothetical protein
MRRTRIELEAATQQSERFVRRQHRQQAEARFELRIFLDRLTA